MVRQASGDLFPSDSPIPASQLIGRRDDVRELATRLEAGTHLIVAGPRRTGKTSVCEAALGRVAPPGRLRREARPVPRLRRRRAGRGARHRRDRQPLGRPPGAAPGPRGGPRGAVGGAVADADPDGRGAGGGGRAGAAARDRRAGPRARARPGARAARAHRARRRPQAGAVLRRVPGDRGRAPAVRRPGRRDEPDASRLPAHDLGELPVRRQHRARDARPVRARRGGRSAASAASTRCARSRTTNGGAGWASASPPTTAWSPRRRSTGSWSSAAATRAPRCGSPSRPTCSRSSSTPARSASTWCSSGSSARSRATGRRWSRWSSGSGCCTSTACSWHAAVAAGESPPRRLHAGVRDRVLKLLRDAGILEHEARGRWRVIDPLLRRYLATLDPFG